MKLFNILKKMTGFDNQDQPVATPTNENCTVKIKLTEVEFAELCKYYYRGYTSYKAFFKHIFLGNPKKTVEIMNGAQEKAASGCYIDHTFVKFYVDEKTRFIEIPFDVYSDKRDMTISMRNTKIWNKNNILRILKIYPHYTEYDDSLISEKLK